MKIALLTNMVAPYRVPLLEHLGARRDVELDVLACVEREADRHWQPASQPRNYRIRRLRGVSLNQRRRSGEISRIIHFRPEILGWLWRQRPDVTIIGDASWTSYLAAWCCRRLGVPYVWWNEILPSTQLSTGPLYRIRRKAILGADGWLASGRLAKQFLSQLGVSPRNIRCAVNSVDNQFYECLRQQHVGRRGEIRQQFGIANDGFALLYAGKLIPRKRVIELLRATAAVDESVRPIHLLMAGCGPLSNAIEAEAGRLGYSRLKLLGHLDAAELAPYYTAADGLALPSDDEPWGMVVNEALLFGKPVLASDRVGAAADLIDERSGVVIGDVSTEGIRRGLVEFVAKTFSPEDCRRQADRATPEKMAAEFIEAARAATDRRQPRNRAA